MSIFGVPHEWDLPTKFTSFRPQQSQALEHALDCPNWMIGSDLPVGSGKSLYAMALHRIFGSKRTVILTATKALQRQYMTDFTDIGLVNIRGRSNYSCMLGLDCDKGWLARCAWRNESRCGYISDFKAAGDAEILVTNYHYWMTIHRKSTLGSFDLLILDEAHQAPAICAGMLTKSIPKRKLGIKGPTNLDDLAWWRDWAGAQLESFQLPDETNTEEFLKAKRWEEDLTTAANLNDDWVVDDAGDAYQLAPTWPGKMASKSLFRGVGKVVMMSATLRPQTLALMGVPVAGVTHISGKQEAAAASPTASPTASPKVNIDNSAWFFNYKSAFPASRSPIYYACSRWHPMVKMAMARNENELNMWISLIDAIIATRLDRKGIIHSVSYAWAQIIKRRSKYSDLMITHDSSRDIQRRVDAFKAHPEPRILLSPSVTTGFDFPNDEARYQILPKLPFPNNSDQMRLAARRKKEDPRYDDHIVAQTIEQAAGRVMRDDTDWGETIIADRMWGWWYGKNSDLFSESFQELVKAGSNGLPDGRVISMLMAA